MLYIVTTYCSQIGKPVAFTCIFNGAKGHLTAKVVAPTGAEDEALIQALDDAQSEFYRLIAANVCGGGDRV